MRYLRFATTIKAMDFKTWLDELIAPETQAKAAEKAGYAQSTISRQLSRGYLRPETVIALARAYDRNPITALVETGYLHDYETDGMGIEYALSKASNEQILKEILKRSDPEARHLFTNDGRPEVLDIPESPLPQARLTPVDDYGTYAANSSEREPHEGDPDYGSGA